MFTQGRTILVAALALAMLGAGPAMAKPGGAGPGATAAIEALEARVDTIETDTPGGVGDSPSCTADQIAKFVSGTWQCDDIDWDDLENVPAGFADDTDDDTLGDVTGCNSGQLAVSGGSNTWACGDDDTGSAATSALATRVTTIENDTPGGVSGCATDFIAKWDGDSWECAADETGGGGGGSPFTLTDTDGGGIAVGTVIGVDLDLPIQRVTVTTLITGADDVADVTSLEDSEKIVMAVVAGAFINNGVLHFTGSGCTGTMVVETSAGFLPAILPAVVVGGTLYVASTTTVVSNRSVLTLLFKNFSCQDVPDSLPSSVEVASEGSVSSLFTTPFVLGGGP